MNDFLDRISKLSPKRLTLLAMELQSKLEANERQLPEPIAIIGLGCRFPGGADGPEAYWKLLSEGRDAIREVPADRWDIGTYYDPDPDCPGKMITRWGGFLDQVDQFEPQFFGLAPREAASMDPQQRLLLEVAWEALEHSGHAPDSFAKSRTGVFVGMCSNDYYQMLMESPSGASNTYLATGNAHSVASGRISYVLGLQGPSMTIDTACSASLVAVHLACKSLNNSECRMALAGGVNAILWPQTTVALSAARMMAPDGRCKTFDAKADGFVRGEGCGIVVLKRLSDAVADGDRVLAVIPGTAVNQDGRSSGLTAPNGPSQTAVIQEALHCANVDPLEVSYVEAHGTGTSLGDPIEVQALAAALCVGRPTDRPLLIGSVKTNIGHLEAAAGIAGLIKVVLALEHTQLPAHLHLQNLNPHVDWSEIPVRITSEPQPWPAASRRVAGISSFGFSGTNAHVIVAEAPNLADQPESSTGRPMEVCCISAGSAMALSVQASRLALHIESNPGLELADICFTLNGGRAHFAHRAAVTAVSTNELRTKLADMAEGKSVAGMKSGIVAGKDKPAIAFLFTGQGSQYAGMGSELYQNEPVFKSAMDRCSELLAEMSPDCSLLSVVYGANSALLNQTQFTQPSLFAMEYALAQMWISYGIRPSFVMGHSVGEYVAACMAGVMSLEAALKLVAMRGRLMQALPAGGGMAAILAPREAVESVLTTYTGTLAIAAVNGPENTVISGKAEALESAIAELESQGIRVQRLNVSHAFHSPLLDSVLDEYERFAEMFEYQAPRIGLVSNLSGSLIDGSEVLNALYWRRHAREAVNFEAGMRALHNQVCRVFVEIGPSPILIGMGKQCIPDAGTTWVPSLRKGIADWPQILESLCELHVRGAQVDWSGIYRGQRRRRVALPTYPFERRRCWINDAERTRQVTPRFIQKNDRIGHALLGRPLESARGETVYSSRVSLESHPFLADHRMQGVCALAAPIYMELALAAVCDFYHETTATIEELTIVEPLVIADNEEYEVQVILNSDADGRTAIEIFSRLAVDNDSGWKKHAAACGNVTQAQSSERIEMAPILEIRQPCNEEDPRQFYSQLGTAGIEFGPRYQSIERLWRRDGEAAGIIRVPAQQLDGLDGFHMHPAVLESCLQLLGACVPQLGMQTDKDDTYLMIGMENYLLWEAPKSAFSCYARLQDASSGAEVLTGEVYLFDDEGREYARLQGVRLKRARRDSILRTAHAAMDQWLYEIEWKKADQKHNTTEAAELLPIAHLAEGTSEFADVLAKGLDILSTQLAENPEIADQRARSCWIIVGEGGGIGDRLASLAATAGVRCIRVSQGPQFVHIDEDSFTIDTEKPAHFDRLLTELPADKNVRSEVVHLLGYDGGDIVDPDAAMIDREIAASCKTALYLTQALVRAEQILRPRLWIVTRSAQPVGEDLAGLRPGQSVVWGLGRTVANEHPEIWGGLIDADFGHAEKNAALIANEMDKQTHEDQIAYRKGARYVARLHRAAPKSPGKFPLLPSDRTYLVTGGTGGMGMKVAKWLIEKGARHLVLNGRSGISRINPEEQQTLEASGVSVVVRAADVTSEDQMRNLFAEIAKTMPKLAGVIHLAGVFDDRVLMRQDWTRFEKVLSPKVHGGWILHELTKDLRLDFFVLFSSGASFLAPAGVSNYSAANSFLDSLAHYRCSIGLPGISINWGPWERVGMAEAVGERREGQWAQAGLDTMTPEQGLATMERLMSSRAAQTAVLIVDWAKFTQRVGNAVLPLYQDLWQSDGKSPADVSHSVPILHVLEQALPAEQRDLLVDHLRDNIIEVLGFDRGYQLDLDKGLFDLGMDSLTAVELKNRLQLSLRRPLPSTLLFDYPNPRKLSDYLAERLKESRLEVGSTARNTDRSTCVATDFALEFEEGVL